MYRKKTVFTAACLGMLSFGIVLTTLGAILPYIFEQYGISKIDAGSLMSLLSIGIMTGSLIFGPVVDRYGYKAMLIISSLLIFIGLEGIAFGSSFLILRLLIYLIGFAGGVINGGTNALVADISEDVKSANLSLLGVFFGIGAISVPFLLGNLLIRFSYSTIMSAIGLIVAAILIFFLFVRFPEPKQKQGFPIAEGLGLLKQSTLLLFGFILFFESGIEITVGSWATSFLNQELSIEADQAVLFLSFYWLGLMLARLVLGYLLKKISPATVLLSCFAIAFGSSIMVIVSNNITFTVLGLFLIGVGFAAGFPVILGYVGEFYARLSGTAFSIVFVIALMGGTILPFLTGVIAESIGLRLSLSIVPASIIMMFILFLVARKRFQYTTNQ